MAAREKGGSPKGRRRGDGLLLYLSYADVHPGYFHIPEPDAVNPAQDEEALLIVPGVGFDAKRHRCGYGKGFYDRI